ncbi:alkaline phosphatase [Streptomyces alfalfae]|uniref:Alkaline phosphatase n=1 Tax=Streptomyces alfalfae TaxID=1642299 RepID=A0ABM6GXG4_9ACTN|nr:alkaline phosphatase D family protein [Streptomyces alfalfae]APY88533.1 alkaline phosphatase [Streptomyces alfalfae]AYA18947.1 alkaline phosphatase family protein [Streptomyces fradiae]RXX36419.1 alkaline phosphatase [Streptomyces alfalfae]RZM90457.1 alkaline phosphatase family protein [Streptomyces alfalfae]
MARLRLGPLLRYVDGSTATVWVETDRPCAAEVRCADGAHGSARTFQVAGHHYALIPVTGLTPGTETAYEVLLDDAPDEDGPGQGDPYQRGLRERGPADRGPHEEGPDQGGIDHGGPEEGGSAQGGPDEGGSEGGGPDEGGSNGGGPGEGGIKEGGPGGSHGRAALVWPEPGSPFPPSTIRTPAGDGGTDFRVTFGSCRWAAPPSGEDDPVGPDALDTLAARIAADPATERPDVLLLLGDQVYADQTSKATRRWLAARRDTSEPPWHQVADYEEYTHLYYESWLDPEVRWLLSTVPSCMIFDDHDVIDDWNTSAAWLAEMRVTPWWRERVLSGLMSYWVHQHIGNLRPDELDSDAVYASVRATPDGTEALRAFAAASDADATAVRWSYRRDFGRVRLLMIDTRAARVLTEGERAMVDPKEARWLREQALENPGGYDHLLIGSSLPWLLPHLIHDAEGWNAALCRGERGERWARFGENLRRRSDLEHWSAFPASFEALTALIAEAGSGPDAPATVCVLSGDVHHAYIAEPTWPAGAGPDARVLQLTCSPVHNSIPSALKLGFRFGWSRVGRALGRRFARHGSVTQAGIDWRRTGGPWFGNQLMTLTLHGRSAHLRLDQARAVRGGGARLEVAEEGRLT